VPNFQISACFPHPKGLNCSFRPKNRLDIARDVIYIVTQNSILDLREKFEMAKSTKLRPASIGLINKKAFWNAYDHLGRLLLVNLFSVLLAITIIGLPAGIIGLFSITAKIANHENITLKEYASPLRKYLKRVVSLIAVLVFLMLLLAANLYFYNAMLHQTSGAAMTFIFSGMQGLMLWLALFFIMFSFYIFPVLFQLDSDFRVTLKNSFFLMLDNLKVSFYLFFSWLFWMFVGVATGIVGFFLSLSVIAVIGNTAVREVLAQYQPKGLEADEETRGLRDLLKPWN
jgi:uncharacterized membrane protein YesL